MGHTYTGGKLVTLFDSYSYNGVSACVWVMNTGPKSWGELLTLFDSYSYDGVTAGIWVIHTGPKSGGKLVTLFDSYCNGGVVLLEAKTTITYHFSFNSICLSHP